VRARPGSTDFEQHLYQAVVVSLPRIAAAVLSPDPRPVEHSKDARFGAIGDHEIGKLHASIGIPEDGSRDGCETMKVAWPMKGGVLMTERLQSAGPALGLLIVLIAVTPAFGQGGRCCGGMMDHGAHAADMQVFHQLFDHRAEIARRVVVRPDGIETVTESTNPEVTRLLQTHVTSMLARVKENSPIHRRDPLFAELFRYADRIEAKYEATASGVHVTETSADPYVARLLQAHAEVVSAFISNGRMEMMKNHPLPLRP
jgi:hypothetical protein